MSRTRNAAVAVGFTYAHYAVSLATGLFLVRYALGELGDRAYGLWLVVSEVVGHLALADLGVFVVLPWLVAAADGAGATDRIRRLVLDGLILGVAVGGAVVAIGVGAWVASPVLFSAGLDDRAELAGPFLTFVCASGLCVPTRVFAATLAGKQDVVFAGVANLAQAVGGVVLTAVLLAQGWGLYALAIGTAGPPLAVGVAAGVRLAVAFPELLRPLPRPSLAGCRGLIRDGLGPWAGVAGVRIMASSSALLLASLGGGEWVVAYACTTKLPAILMNMAWTVPDACLVGLAQLHAGGNRVRARQVAGQLVWMNVLIGLFLAVAVLLANPLFVTRWVGEGRYAGDLLNGLAAAAAAVACLGHGLITPIGAVGARGRVGLAALANGLLYLALVASGWSSIGVYALPVGYVLSTAVTQVAVGLWLTRTVLGVTPAGVVPGRAARYLPRVGVALAGAATAGSYLPTLPPYLNLPAGAAVGAAAVWALGPLLAGLEWPVRVARILRACRLIAGPAPGA